MDGKEAIIAEIIQKAEDAAAALIRDASAERDAELEKTRNEQIRKRDAAVAAANKAASETVERGKSLCALEARKTMLAAKQQLIDRAYKEAERKILNMTDPVYREFIGDLIVKYAEDGDRVVVAERDVRRLHADFIAELAQKAGKTITLSEQTHSGNGGVILTGKQVDKNLTLDALLHELRQKTQGQAANRLFKGI
ncbi:MAG: V-type ATP synthase subunit E [Clostridiales bacterium]|nr:V-type ATP synthase subunit E [Clostridiales bacterium]